MANDLTTFPWQSAVPSVADDVAALKLDFAYAVANTAVTVHSDNPAFVMTANTRRGQIVPQGKVKFSDGTTVELQDIGMCQPNVPHMTVREIMARIWAVATELGLELARS